MLVIITVLLYFYYSSTECISMPKIFVIRNIRNSMNKQKIKICGKNCRQIQPVQEVTSVDLLPINKSVVISTIWLNSILNIYS